MSNNSKYAGHRSFVLFGGGHLNENVKMSMLSMLKFQIFSILIIL